MRNRLFLIAASFFLLATLLVLNSCDKEEEGSIIQISGVEFTPNLIEKDGEIVGKIGRASCRERV